MLLQFGGKAKRLCSEIHQRFQEGLKELSEESCCPPHKERQKHTILSIKYYIVTSFFYFSFVGNSFYTIYSDYGFSFPNSSEFLPTSTPIQIHSLSVSH